MATAQIIAKASPFRASGSLALNHLHKLAGKSGGLRAVDLLGGKVVLGKNASQLSDYDPLLWDNAITSGLPLKALDFLLESFTVAQQPLLEILGVNLRWLQRKRKLVNPVLDVDAAARAVGLALLIEKAIDVLGSPEAADQWLSLPNQALGGAVPLALAGRPMGNQAVMDSLNSILHGMFS